MLQTRTAAMAITLLRIKAMEQNTANRPYRSSNLNSMQQALELEHLPVALLFLPLLLERLPVELLLTGVNAAELIGPVLQVHWFTT